MLNKSYESSFRKEFDGSNILLSDFSAEPLKSASSFTRNRLLRHVGLTLQDEPQNKQVRPKVLEPLNPIPPKLSTEGQNKKAEFLLDNPKNSKKIKKKEEDNEKYDNESIETPSEGSVSSFSSKEDNDEDDEFIRKQTEARVEYRGVSDEELKPIPSTSLPLVKSIVSFDVNDCEEIDPNLLALEEYLSEAKLKAATGEDNLKNVKHLEIIVNTTNNSLGDVGSKLPNLEELKLNGSTIPSIRDLGTSLKFVRILWLSRCGIGELDGISTFSRLKELYLSYNDIEDISDLSGMEELEVLDLEGNNIDDELQLIYISDCKRLTSLTIAGNPLIVKMPAYRSMVKSTLPTLEYLDDLPLIEDEMNDRGISPIKKDIVTPSLEELENEFEMLKKSIKFSRMESLDETLNDNPLILTISNRLYNPADNNMIRNITTSTPRLDGGRPQSASFFRRPTTSSSSIFRSMSKSRIGLRPSTSQIRPTTSSLVRPTTASSVGSRPMTASSDRGRASLTFSSSSQELEEDTSSHLTYKAKEVYCGNIVKGLKKKKQQEPMFLARTESTDVEMDILTQVQQRKIQTLDEPNEELEEFLNEVYEGFEKDEEVSYNSISNRKNNERPESFSLDNIPVYEDIFNEPSKRRSGSLKNNR